MSPGGDTSPIEVVLRDDSASLSGTVRSDRKTVRGTVVLVPESVPRQVVAISTGGDGRFQFQSLAPGRYFLVAVKTGTEMDLENPETLRRIQSLGESVELQADGAASIDLEVKKWEE